ncbi:carbohydrate ABC transporter permease [Sinirhodobacter populi]|uniref:Maltose/maltodextrin transport system permease protein MalG n=2 Tax=Paenirhodobacter populi TaxID=2306993 RepID=A0A443JF19_9RHOB|nr:carbohydrate ABC transporter permease [Sinirhodobacter populi]
MSRIMSGKIRNRLGLVAFGALVLVFNLGPILWGILGSLRPRDEIMRYPPQPVPSSLSLEHYRTIAEGGFLSAAQASLIYAVVTVVVSLIAGSIAAYALDRIRFVGRSVVMFLVLAGIPLASGAAALIVPTYLYMVRLGLNDTIFVLPLVYIAYNLPTAVWVLRGALGGVSRELDEAAAIDGAGRLRTLFEILLPLCKPALGAAALFCFVGAWNEFVAGSVLVDNPDLRPIQVSIYQNMGYFGRDWGPLLASATLAIFPIIIAFLIFGRLLISGLTKGAVKG